MTRVLDTHEAEQTRALNAASAAVLDAARACGYRFDNVPQAIAAGLLTDAEWIGAQAMLRRLAR